MLVSYTVGVANSHEYRGVYFFYILRPIIWLQVYTDNLFNKFREMGRIVSKTIVLSSYDGAVEHICGEGRITGLDIGPPPIVLIRTRQHHEPAYLLRMAHSYLKGYSASHAISQYIRTIYFKVLQQTGYIVCHTFVTKFAGYILCAAVPLHFRYYYFPVFGQQGYDMQPIQRYIHIRAVQQYNGFTVAVNLIVHF